jgi:MYND finger
MCFDDMNEMAEIEKGLRPKRSGLEELAREKVMLERGLKALRRDMEGVSNNWMVRDNLEFHETELKRVDRELKAMVIAGDGTTGKKIGDAIKKEWDKLDAMPNVEDIDPIALARCLSRIDKLADLPLANEGFECTYCGKSSEEKMPCCSRCKKQSYCSRDCQSKHWKVHKQDCKPVAAPPTSNTSQQNSAGEPPLTWDDLEDYRGLPAEDKVLEVKMVLQDTYPLRFIAMCKDSEGVTKRVAAYTSSKTIPGLRLGKVMRWKNPRYHMFADGSDGARIEDGDLPNITIT